MNIIISMVVILMLLGALPLWPYNASWGYYPSIGIGFVLLVLLLLRTIKLEEERRRVCLNKWLEKALREDGIEHGGAKDSSSGMGDKVACRTQ